MEPMWKSWLDSQRYESDSDSNRKSVDLQSTDVSWEDNLDASLLKRIGISIIDNNFVYCKICGCWLPQLSDVKTANVHNIKIHTSGRRHRSRMGLHNCDSLSDIPTPDIPTNVECIQKPLTTSPLIYQPFDGILSNNTASVDSIIEEICQQYCFNRYDIILKKGNNYTCNICLSHLTLTIKCCENILTDHFNGKKHKRNLRKINVTYPNTSSPIDELCNLPKIKKKEEIDSAIKEICQRYHFNHEYIIFKNGYKYNCKLCGSCLHLAGKNNEKVLKDHMGGKKHIRNLIKIGVDIRSLNDQLRESQHCKNKEEIDSIIKEVCRQYQFSYDYIVFKKGHEYNCKLCDVLLNLSNKQCRKVLQSHFSGKKHIRKLSSIKGINSVFSSSSASPFDGLSNMSEITKKEEIDSVIKEVCQQYQFNHEYIVLRSGNEYECSMCKCLLVFLSGKNCSKLLKSHFGGKRHRRKVGNVCEVNSGSTSSSSQPIIHLSNVPDEKVIAVVEEMCRLYQFSHEYIVFKKGDKYDCILCNAHLKLTIKGCKKELTSHFNGKNHRKNQGKISEANQLKPNNLCLDNYHIEHNDNSENDLQPNQLSGTSKITLPPGQISLIDMAKLIREAFSLYITKKLYFNKKFIFCTLDSQINCYLCNFTISVGKLNPLCLSKAFTDHFVSDLHANSLKEPLVYNSFTGFSSSCIHKILGNYKSSVLIKILYELPDDINYFNINDFVEFTSDDDCHRIIICNACLSLFEVDNKMQSLKDISLFDHILSRSHKENSLTFNKY